MDKVAFFDELAPRWEEVSRSGVGRMVEVLDRVCVRPGSRILDIGSGTGRTVRYFLARLGPAGRVTAVDFSTGMLDILCRSVRDRRLECVHADVGELPESITGFDLVVLFDVLPHLDRAEEVLADLAHRLVPGGLLVLAHDVGREECNQVHRQHGGSVHSDRLPHDEVLIAMFTGARLEIEQLHQTPHCYLLVGRKPPGAAP